MNYYTIFPKLQLIGNSGILIGELIIICMLMIRLSFGVSAKISNTSLLFSVLAFYNFIGCNIPHYSSFDEFILDIMYFTKVILPIFAAFILIKKYEVENGIGYFLQKYIYRPFWIISLLSSCIFIYYFIKLNPSIGDILWGYNIGYRLVPSFGTMILGDNTFIQVIGGASGNLYGTFAAIVLITYLRSTNQHINVSKIILIVLLTLLTFSRGSIATTALIVLCLFPWRSKNALLRINIITSIVIFVMFINWKLIGDTIPIFTRIIETISSGQLDLSSLERVKILLAFYDAWSGSLWNILFGLGTNEQILIASTGYPFVESFLFQLIFGTGILGCFLFAVWVYKFAFFGSKGISFVKIYFIFQFVFQWSFTGGDFWGPINIYICAIFMAYKMHCQKIGGVFNENTTAR